MEGATSTAGAGEVEEAQGARAPGEEADMTSEQWFGVPPHERHAEKLEGRLLCGPMHPISRLWLVVWWCAQKQMQRAGGRRVRPNCQIR